MILAILYIFLSLGFHIFLVASAITELKFQGHCSLHSSLPTPNKISLSVATNAREIIKFNTKQP